MTSIMSKTSARRLACDIRQMKDQSLSSHGIYYFHDDTHMLTGYALIIGPEGTPYFGGNYFFKFTFPVNYPYSPPQVTYCTNESEIRFHPNLYINGKVCLSILNTWHGDQWSSCLTLSSVLLAICTLFTTNPLLHEPGIQATDSALIVPYTAIVEYGNLDVAVCDILYKTSGIVKPFMEQFEPIMHALFCKNSHALIELAQRKSKEIPIAAVVRSPMYELAILVNYSRLVTKLVDLQNTLMT